MRRPRGSLLVVLLLLGVPGALVLRAFAWAPLPVAGPAPDDGLHRLSGVLHVHTTVSDGGGSPEEVIAAARAAGLGFLAISDHDTLGARPWQGYRGGVLVLVGTEISTSAGHLLALGLSHTPAYRFSGDVQDAFEDVRELGGRAFAAHPLSPRADYRFAAWDHAGPWGMELVNGDSQWRKAGWPRLLRTLLLYPADHAYALLGSVTEPEEALARWDRELLRRDVAGTFGADAHSRIQVRKRWALRFPSYEALFGVFRQHVLLDRGPSGSFEEDAAAVIEALGRGRSYLGLDGLAPAGGFLFLAEGEGGRWTMGDTVDPARVQRLRAGGRVPPRARVRLLRDGAVLAEAEGAVEAQPPGPGVYRVEVRVPGWDVPWVISNPVYLFGSEVAEARRRAGEWGAEEPVPEPMRVLDAFEGPTAFGAEFDPSSAMPGGILAPGAGPDGSGAGRLSFRLGAPGPGRPTTWCALADRTPRDLGGTRGLVFRLRADGVRRLWVQLRDANPASADEGQEWWFASVKATPEWRRVVVPYARLRTLNPRTDGRPDPERTRGIVFVLDQAAAEPGTSGTIWIDDLGVY